MSKYLITLLLLGTMALVVLAGCSQATPTPTPIPPTPTPTPVPPTPTPMAQATSEPAAEAPMQPYYEALEALEAYTATLVMEYEPREGSDQSPFRVFFTEERAKTDPPVQRVRIRGLSSVDPNNSRNDATYTFIGDATWFIAGEERFYTTRPTGQRRLYLSPEDMIPVTTKLAAQGPYDEKVNGLDVDYYTIADPKDILGDGPDQPENAELLQGDVWIAREGNFITRYVLRVRADDLKMRDEPTPGTLTIEYNVTPLSPDEVKVEPPEDAVSLETAILPGFEPGTFPVPEGAEVETIIQAPNQQLIGLAASDMSLTDAFAFYQERLSAAGWEENEADHQEQEDLLIFSSWEKGEDTIVLMMRAMPGGAGVQILAQNAPPTAEQ